MASSFISNLVYTSRFNLFHTLYYNAQIWRLQAALGEQTEVTKFSQDEYERLQHVMFSTLVDCFWHHVHVITKS